MWVSLLITARLAHNQQEPSKPILDNPNLFHEMSPAQPSYYHLHLVSDATGETLTTIAKAASVQYA